MNRKLISKAISNIDDAFIEEAMSKLDGDFVFAYPKGGGDVEEEGGVAALVLAYGLAVDKDFASVVHGAEVQTNLSGQLGQVHRALVPHAGQEILVLHAGEGTFRAEGD